VDNLEGRVATLEENQFSTTSKLDGEVLFGVGKAFEPVNVRDSFQNFLADRFPGSVNEAEDGDDERDVGNETVFGNRVRLEINTSFTGQDQLSVRYQFREMEEFDKTTTGTNMTDLAFGGEDGNRGRLDNLVYQFPVTDAARFYIGANSIDADQGAIRPLNPLFESSGSGSLSQALQRDELIFDIPDDVSLGAKLDFSESVSLAAYYGVEGQDARNPRRDKGPGGEGLFEGSFGVLTQLLFEPNDSIDLAFTYSHSYTDGFDNTTTPNVASLGSRIGNQPFGNIATTSDRFGLQSNFQVSNSINFSLWGSYARASSEANHTETISGTTADATLEAQDGDSADLFSFGGTLAFLDLAKEGDRLGFGVAVPPKVANNDAQITTAGESADYEDEDTSVIVEAQYRYPITDRLHITPGGYAVINPGHNSNNDTNFVGILKTEFDF